MAVFSSGYNNLPVFIQAATDGSSGVAANQIFRCNRICCGKVTHPCGLAAHRLIVIGNTESKTMIIRTSHSGSRCQFLALHY